MPDDPIAQRFEKRKKGEKLTDLGRRARSAEELAAERQLLKDTEKVKPIKAGEAPNRNDPCPCGSGRKYKRCCGKAD